MGFECMIICARAHISCKPILLLDYKLTLPKYNIITTKFVELEIYALAKWALWLEH
jgi:hypothetical protein